MWFRRDGRHFGAAIKAWFRSLKKLQQVAIGVILAHIIAVLWMGIDHCLSGRPKIRHPVIVRTIRPHSPAPIAVASAPASHRTAPPSSRPTPATVPSHPPKNTPAKSRKPPVAVAAPAPVRATKKQSASLSTRSSKKTVDNKKNPPAPPTKKVPAEALEQIEEDFHALAEETSFSSHSSIANIPLPAPLQSRSALNASLEETISQESIPSSYHLSLIELLQSSLQLPEIGDVRIKIVLSAPGTISTVQILEAKSKKNAEWLKNQLPLLSLPCFTDFGIVDAVLEFTITFRNVENS